MDVIAKINEINRLRLGGNLQDAFDQVVELLRHADFATRSKVMFLRADVLMDMGRYSDAVCCYDEILEDEKIDIAYNNRGLALWELGRIESAIESYENSLKLNPKNNVARFSVAELYRETKNFEMADRHYEVGRSLFPMDTKFLLGLAHSKSESAECSEAYRLLLEVLRIEPDNREAKAGIEHIEKLLEID